MDEKADLSQVKSIQQIKEATMEKTNMLECISTLNIKNEQYDDLISEMTKSGIYSTNSLKKTIKNTFVFQEQS